MNKFNLFITLALIASLSSNALKATKRNEPATGKIKTKKQKSKKQKTVDPSSAGSDTGEDAPMTVSSLLPTSSSLSSSSSSSRIPQPQCTHATLKTIISVELKNLAHDLNSPLAINASLTQPKHHDLSSSSSSSSPSTLSSSSSNSSNDDSDIDDDDSNVITLSCKFATELAAKKTGLSDDELKALTQCIEEILLIDN